VERRVAGDHLHILLGGAQLERDRCRRQRAHDVEHQPRRQHDHALADDLRLERHPQSNVHVGRAQLAARRGGDQLHPGQGLDRRARGGDPADGLQL
jgi:hypothetical protein